MFCDFFLYVFSFNKKHVCCCVFSEQLPFQRNCPWSLGPSTRRCICSRFLSFVVCFCFLCFFRLFCMCVFVCVIFVCVFFFFCGRRTFSPGDHPPLVGNPRDGGLIELSIEKKFLNFQCLKFVMLAEPVLDTTPRHLF